MSWHDSHTGYFPSMRSSWHERTHLPRSGSGWWSFSRIAKADGRVSPTPHLRCIHHPWHSRILDSNFWVCTRICSYSRDSRLLPLPQQIGLRLTLCFAPGCIAGVWSLRVCLSSNSFQLFQPHPLLLWTSNRHQTICDIRSYLKETRFFEKRFSEPLLACL